MLKPEAAKLKVLFGPLIHPLSMGDYIYQANTLGFCFLNEGGSGRIPHPAPYAPLLFPEQLIRLDFKRSMTWSLEDIFAHLPAHWEPDLVIWHSFVYMPPADLHSCPYPLFLVAYDWHYQYSVMRHYFDAFDHIFCDRALLQSLRKQGFENVSYWPNYSFDPRVYHTNYNEQRIWDVSFTGNINPDIYAQRNAYLLKLAELGSKYRVYLGTNLQLQHYARVLNQSKIAFNHSIRGEMNLRSYEAAACGALLLNEESNLEIADFLPPGEACVLYNADNFQDCVHYYLQHEQERNRIAQTGQRLIQQHNYTQQFTALLNQLPASLEQLNAAKIKQRQQRSKIAQMKPVQALVLRGHIGIVSDMPELRQQALDAMTQFWTKLPQNHDASPLVQSRLSEQELVLNAIAVGLNRNKKAFENTQSAAFKAFQAYSELEKNALHHPIIQHNLAWMAYFHGDWDALAARLRQLEICFSKTLVPGCLEDCDQFVMPLATSAFHQRWLFILHEYADDPTLRHQALSKLILWSGYYLFGLYASQNQNWDLACQTLSLACQYQSHFPESFLAWAEALYQQKSYALAEVVLEQGLKQGVFFFESWCLFCEILWHQNKQDKAQKTLAVMTTLFQYDRSKLNTPRFQALKMRLG